MIELGEETPVITHSESRIIINNTDYGRVWNEKIGYRAQLSFRQGCMSSFFGNGETKIHAVYDAIAKAKVEITEMSKLIEEIGGEI